jgi:Leucine-rich repeat (LRR) protein
MKILCAIGIVLSLVGISQATTTYCEWKEVEGKYTCMLYNGYFTSSDGTSITSLRTHVSGKTDDLVLRAEVVGVATEIVLKALTLKHKFLEDLIVENGTIDALQADSKSFADSDPGLNAIKYKKLKISRGTIKTLPARAFHWLTSLKTLDLSKNEINSIDSNVDEGLTILENLILDDNQISSASINFARLNMLKVFSIAGNKLSSLPTALPSKATLVKIDLSRNLLTTIADNYFNGYSALEELYLHQNQISTLNADSFASLNIKILNIASNKFQNFEFLRKAAKLENLTIASQMPKIKQLNSTMLDGNLELKIFNASHNEITQLYNSLFAKNAEKITTLDMRGNRIERIEGGFLGTLRNLNATLLSCNKCISKDFYTRPSETEFQVCKSSSIIVSTALIALSAILSVKLF